MFTNRQYLVSDDHITSLYFVDFTSRERHEKKLPITALAWQPTSNQELAYADANGYVGLLEDVVPKSSAKKQV